MKASMYPDGMLFPSVRCYAGGSTDRDRAQGEEAPSGGCPQRHQGAPQRHFLQTSNIQNEVEDGLVALLHF